jgi:hypothetical protein
VRHPVLPFWVDYGTEKVPQAFYWSRALLLHGGPIEGIVASRNLLGFFALLAVIVFAVQLAAGTVKRNWGIGWLVLALVMLVLTRSATVTVAALAVAAAFLLHCGPGAGARPAGCRCTWQPWRPSSWSSAECWWRHPGCFRCSERAKT